MPTSPTGAPYRDVASARRLAEPPRRVARRLALILCIGGALGTGAWFSVAVGSVVAWAIGSSTDFSPLTVHGPVEHVDGRALHTDERSSRKNHEKSYAVSFAFVDADGHEHRGVSYSGSGGFADGAPVTVEVPHGRPDQAVILGLRRQPVPLGIWLVTAILPLAGLVGAGFRLVRGRAEVRLLERGQLGQGKLVHRETTIMHVNNRTVEKLSFDFEDARGRVHRTVVRTHRPERITDEALEPLVYDPDDPTRAALLDALPGAPRIDEAGGVGFDGSPWTLLAALGLPFLALLANLVAAVIVL